MRRAHFLAFKDLLVARGELYEKCRALISVNLNELFYTSGLAVEVPHKREWWLGQLLRLYNDDLSRVLVAAWRRMMPNPLATYMLAWKEALRENESMRETVVLMGHEASLRDGRRYLEQGDRLQMWFRILRFKKHLRLGLPEPEFPPLKAWEEWLDKRKAWYLTKEKAKKQGEGVLQLRIFRRMEIYLQLRRKKHHNAKLAHRQANQTIVQPAFHTWSEVMKHALADRCHLHLRCLLWHQAAVELKRYRNSVVRYQTYVGHARTLEAIEAWQVYIHRRRVHKLAGMKKLVEQPQKALFAIYCLQNDDSMRVYMECFKRWSSFSRRRVLYERFVAGHASGMGKRLLQHCFDKIKDAAKQYKESDTYR